MWNFHVWRTLVWPLCNGSEWWWYLWKGNLSLFWTNQTRLLSLAWFWSCGRMKKKKWNFDHLPEMTLCTVQRSPRGKQNYFSYGPFNGLSDPHTFVPARHTFQICRLNHMWKIDGYFLLLWFFFLFAKLLVLETSSHVIFCVTSPSFTRPWKEPRKTSETCKGWFVKIGPPSTAQTRSQRDTHNIPLERAFN